MNDGRECRVHVTADWDRLSASQKECVQAVARATLGWGYRWGGEFAARFHVRTGDPEGLPAGVAMYREPGNTEEFPPGAPEEGDITVVPRPLTDGRLSSTFAHCISSGALVLAEDSPELGRSFLPGSEIVTYRGPHDLVERVFFYLDHPDELKAIAGRGRARFAKRPMISIIIFVYNGAPYLREAIESGLNQDYPDFELMVVDDGSTDNTPDIVRSVKSPRLRYIRQEHAGAPAARNLGIREAKGEFVVWLGSDDVLSSDCLAKHAGILRDYPDADVIYGDIALCDANLKTQRVLRYQDWYGRSDEMPAAMVRANVIPDGGTLIRKECYDRVGGYDEKFVRAHDYEWWSRLIGNARFKYDNQEVYRWRWHGANLGAGSAKQIDTRFEAAIVGRMEERFPLEKLFPELEWKQGSRQGTEAIAQTQLAQLLAGYGDINGAIRHLERSHSLLPLPATEVALSRLRSLPRTPGALEHPLPGASQRASHKQRRPLSITYLINSILGVTGGNQTLLRQANELVRRGHSVSIITRTGAPAWFPLRAHVVRVPESEPLASFVPVSDVVVSTYFLNTHELCNVNAPVKIYFAQGDQFVFEDESTSLKPEQERVRRKLKELSRASYLFPGARFVPNSRALASAVERLYGRKSDAILPVCVDAGIFKPLQRAARDSRPRLLVVGPDVDGSELEPLAFKGMRDILQACERMAAAGRDFTVVRIANSERSIFQSFPCEFYIAPSDELKTYLFGTANVLIYASHYDSCPRPPLEAMASGAAVVCTATTGALEYCVDGENSLLVQPGSPADLAIAVARLLDDLSLRERLIRGGLETASRRPQEREWDELEGLCYRYLDESGEPSAGRAMPDSSPAAGIDTILDQAYRAFAKKEFKSALEIAETIIPRLPDAPQLRSGIRNFRGLCLLEMEELEEARTSFQEALTDDPESAQACIGLGKVFLRSGVYDAAKQMFEWGVRYDPQNESANTGLLEANRALGLADDDNSLNVAEGC